MVKVKKKSALPFSCDNDLGCVYLTMQDAYDGVINNTGLDNTKLPISNKMQADLINFFHDVGNMFPKVFYPVKSNVYINYRSHDPLHIMPFMQGPGLPKI